jgi:tripartite ATP-independent transporter DctM subunit
VSEAFIAAAPAARKPLATAENALALFAMAGIALLPLGEIASLKLFGVGIAGSTPIAQNLTLWVGMLGAAIAARDGKLLSLATSEFMPKGTAGTVLHVIAAGIGAGIATIFAFGGVELVQSSRHAGQTIIEGLPVWIAQLVFPFAFGLIAVRLVHRASDQWIGRAAAALGVVAALYIASHHAGLEGRSLWPALIILIGAGVLGAPIFALLGGIAMFAYFSEGNQPVAPLIDAYSELTRSVGLAAIPLFTLAGFLLAEGRASERLLRVFRTTLGWMPGGTAIAAAALCAFFTLFTGGSGVTILAIGGLLLPALLADGYPEKFSIGLLTASGSLGLLFPLSVPLMLYGIVASGSNVPVDLNDLFIGGILPGLVMLGLVAVLGVRASLKAKTVRTKFDARSAMSAIWEAKWELFLPVVVLGSLLGGIATTVQSAAVAALYTFIVQRFIHRDLPTMKDVLRVVGDCTALVGGVLIILSVAIGLTSYLVLANIPADMLDWTQQHIHSPALFLLALNVFLLIVGTLMDIFSAIVVVVPLILPLAAPFGINPVHLGIIFIANLELGYLHPPLGLNLLLASYRFKKPVLQVMWATLPMLGILAGGVLLITYWEGLTMGILHWMGR